MSGGGCLPSGEEKSLLTRAADTVPWDNPLRALSAQRSSGSRVQVTRGGGGGGSPLCSTAWWAVNPSAALGCMALLYSSHQPRSPHPGVTTRGRACVNVYERVEVARVPTAWGGGPLRGRGRAGLPRTCPPPAPARPQFLACGPVTGFGLILIFVLPGPAPLPGPFSRSARLSEDCFQVSFTQRKCSLYLGVSSPFLSPPPSNFPANRLVSVWTVAFSNPGMISSWLFLINQSGCRLPLQSCQRGTCGISK